MSAEFIQENSNLESKCNWHSCLTMSSTEHDSVSFPFCQICQSANQYTQHFPVYGETIFDLQTDCCIDNIVACSAKMNAPTGISRRFSHGFREGHDIVPSFSFDFINSFGSDDFRIRYFRNLGIVFIRHATELIVCPNQGSLNL